MATDGIRIGVGRRRATSLCLVAEPTDECEEPAAAENRPDDWVAILRECAFTADEIALFEETYFAIGVKVREASRRLGWKGARGVRVEFALESKIERVKPQLGDAILRQRENHVGPFLPHGYVPVIADERQRPLLPHRSEKPIEKERKKTMKSNTTSIDTDPLVLELASARKRLAELRSGAAEAEEGIRTLKSQVYAAELAATEELETAILEDRAEDQSVCWKPATLRKRLEQESPLLEARHGAVGRQLQTVERLEGEIHERAHGAAVKRAKPLGKRVRALMFEIEDLMRQITAITSGKGVMVSEIFPGRTREMSQFYNNLAVLICRRHGTEQLQYSDDFRTDSTCPSEAA